MKTRLILLATLLFIVCAVNAQTKFTIPAPTMEEKANMNKMLMNNNILALITVAKNEGITAEELGKKSGAVFFPGWETNPVYEQFVNFALYAWACSADGVQIIEQSSEKVVITLSSLYPQVENQGVLYGSSVEEYTAFFNAMMSAIAVHLGYSFEMTRRDEGYRIVITQ